MAVRNDLNTEAILARFRSQKSSVRRSQARTPARAERQSEAAVKLDIHLDARISASGLKPSASGSDSVEISLSANMTVEAANGIVMDSVVEQINKAIQEAGLDLTIEETLGSGKDTSPEATAGRIAEFAGGFLPAYEANRAPDPARIRIQGFMTLIRSAIQEGFHQARDFLEGVTKLSDTIDENISRTFELTGQYLDDFHQKQIDLIDNAGPAPDPSPSGGTDERPDTTTEESQ